MLRRKFTAVQMTTVWKPATTSIADLTISVSTSTRSTTTLGATHLRPPTNRRHGRRKLRLSATILSRSCKLTLHYISTSYLIRPFSLSEYGCTKTARKFDEVKSLYSEDMTAVYSGGLVYEYSVEGDTTQQKFGLVDLSSGKPNEQPDFSALEDAFKGTPLPTGDGGYKTDGVASTCPDASKSWLVGNDTLPAMPPKASDYFKNGAGKGEGLKGDGSQDVGQETTATATAGSGKPTTSGTANAGGANPTSSKGAASSLRVPEVSAAPYACALVVILSTLLGATLL